MVESKPVAVKSQNNTLGIISLVTGILGVLLFVCCSYLSVVLGIVALICGILAHQQQQQFALPGIILGAIAIVLGIIFVFVSPLLFYEFFQIIGSDFNYQF